MDANAPRRGGSSRLRASAAPVAAAVIGLVAIVAVASSGSATDGGIAEHRPSEGLVDALLSLFLVLMAVCVVVVAVLVSFFGRYTPTGGPPKRRSAAQSIVTFVVTMVLLALLVHALAGGEGRRAGIIPPLGGENGDPADGPTSGYQPRFAVWPVVVVTALVLVALGAWWLSARGRRATRAPLPATPEEALGDVLAETLDDLRAEGDPRRAVIRAYARMERSLAAVGLPRGPAEAPEEYLSRVLADVAVSERSAGRLTALFTWARFSGHDVRPEMKDEALATLEQVQLELEAAEIARRAEPAGAPA
jgi:Domain of unknown function (DUF4129)